MQKIAKKRRMPAQTGRFIKDKQRDEKYLDKLKNISYNPIFILGLHRSGTSILYKMLRSSNKFNSLTAYDVIYYNRLMYNKIHGYEEEYKQRFNNLIRKTGQEKRDIDKIKMDADFAIEYSFLLGPPYLFQQLKPTNIDLFDQVCKKVQFVKDKNKPLLLKNPWDFPNFIYIKRKIPNAKFIFIHRHPVDMMNSSMNALRVIVNQETVYSDIFSPFAKKIDENPLLKILLQSLLFDKIPLGLSLVMEHRFRYTRKFLTNIKRIDENSFINIKYEDLCSQTTETMKKIVQHVQMEDIDVEQFTDFINPRNLTYSADVKLMKKYIMNRFEPYCKYFNYS